MPAPLVLLGPQRLAPTLKDALDSAGVEGPLVAITAGWEEREAEDDELREHVGGRSTNLGLYRRAEEVFERDPELFRAMRARRDRLLRLQELYGVRLGHALEAARELLRREGDEPILLAERAAAIDDVRRIDADHMTRVAEVDADFREEWRPGERPEVARHREDIAARVREAAAVCVAGGHVGVLLNRLRLFGLRDVLGGAPVFAWSAGAMALCERVVLFHDSPPQGPGDAELLGPGLGIAPAIVALPHGRERLRLDDRARVALFAMRFGPALCAVMGSGTRFVWSGGRWRGAASAARLREDGEVAEVAA